MKKWMAFFLAMVMALSLWACGKDDGSKGTAPTEGPKVQAMLFTEMVMTEKNSEGGKDAMKGLVEYDENYNIIGTKTYLNGKLNYEVTYDHDMDRPLSQKSYNQDGQLSDTTEYTYDEKGNCLERTTTYYGEATLTSKTVSTYDADGNKLTMKAYENGTLNYEVRYTYNADGKLAKEVHIEDGVEAYWTEKTYDDHGNIVMDHTDGMLSGSKDTYENIYDGDKLVEVKIYDYGTLYRHIKYDSDGNEILSIGYDSETGEEWSRTESTYEKGNLVKKMEYTDGKLQSSTTYSYNAKGELTAHILKITGQKTQSRLYAYDKDGCLSGIKAYLGDEVISEYTLSYKSVTISEEVAQRIEELNATLAPF